MKITRFFHRERSIVTTITVLVCGIVTICVILGGVMLIRTEFGLVQTFMTKHIAKINYALDDRQKSESENLRDYMAFIAQMLNQAGAELVFKKDVNAINKLLTPYMKHPAIITIRISDQEDVPFDAMWKQSGFTFFGKDIPENVKLDTALSVNIEVEYYNRKVGNLEVYYSDATLQEKIGAIKEAASVEAKTFTEESEQQLRDVIIRQSLGIGVILVILVFCLLIALRVFVRKPLLLLAGAARQFGEFDLTVSIETQRKDELGTLLHTLNDMAGSFRTLIREVQHSGIQVTSSATELSATAKEQETIVTSQVESTRRVLKSTEEISNILTELVNTMQQVAVKSQGTAQYANRGQSDLAHMEDAMHQMEKSSVSISSRLQTISEKADNITTVVTTITKVAEQTNLLSLNAAIEAEKAGEYGRGFTVVAREIRRLADQTAVATLDIKQMVDEMQTAVSTGVMEMDKFIVDVRHSAEDVEQISLQLARIIEQVQDLSPNFDEVNTAMAHQADNAHKITDNMEHLSEEMLETQDSLHETYSAIDQLNDAARSLRDEVSRFKVD